MILLETGWKFDVFNLWKRQQTLYYTSEVSLCLCCSKGVFGGFLVGFFVCLVFFSLTQILHAD